jgi:hypothetical protein
VYPKSKYSIRTTLAVLHDGVAAALAWSFAYLLRFNFELPPNFAEELHKTIYSGDSICIAEYGDMPAPPTCEKYFWQSCCRRQQFR